MIETPNTQIKYTTMSLRETVKEITAYAAKKSGNPKNVLEKLKVPLPTLLPRDLLVKNIAASVNPVDYKVLSGDGSLFEKPKIAGYDAVGIVAEVGEKTSFYKVGDKVMYAGSILREGTYAEYTAVDERIVGKVPSKWTDAEIATLPLVGLTAYEGLFENLRVSKNTKENEGKSILIINGAGGVGSIAIQLAKWVGLTVAATASRKETIEFCKNLGADYVINHREELSKQTSEIETLKNGFDYVYHCSGDLGPYFDVIGQLLKPRGRLVSIVAAKDGGLVKLDGDYFRKRLEVSFELMFSKPIFGYDLESQKEILDHLADLADSGVLKSTMNKALKFEDIIKANEEVLAGKAIGKISLSWE